MSVPTQSVAAAQASPAEPTPADWAAARGLSAELGRMIAECDERDARYTRLIATCEAEIAAIEAQNPSHRAALARFADLAPSAQLEQEDAPF